jgi:hypothetical protein
MEAPSKWWQISTTHRVVNEHITQRHRREISDPKPRVVEILQLRRLLQYRTAETNTASVPEARSQAAGNVPKHIPNPLHSFSESDLALSERCLAELPVRTGDLGSVRAPSVVPRFPTDRRLPIVSSRHGAATPCY